jgi:hypothetical protein
MFHLQLKLTSSVLFQLFVFLASFVAPLVLLNVTVLLGSVGLLGLDHVAPRSPADVLLPLGVNSTIRLAMLKMILLINSNRKHLIRPKVGQPPGGR